MVSCGGIGTAQQARAVIDEGADAVQLYTAFVYEGPGLPGDILRGLTRDRA